MGLVRPVLLAPWLCQVSRIVGGPNHHTLLRVGQKNSGDISGKRCVSTGVAGYMPAVDPHVCEVVNGSEMEQETVRPILRIHPERAAVPHNGVERRVPNPAGG
jgi:hypothetical protein